jgi:hypothetical protein
MLTVFAASRNSLRIRAELYVILILRGEVTSGIKALTLWWNYEIQLSGVGK